MKICSKCQLKYDEKFTFCQKCGNKLEISEEKPVCTNCGKEIDTDGEFCPYCGTIVVIKKVSDNQQHKTIQDTSEHYRHYTNVNAEVMASAIAQKNGRNETNTFSQQTNRNKSVSTNEMVLGKKLENSSDKPVLLDYNIKKNYVKMQPLTFSNNDLEKESGKKDTKANQVAKPSDSHDRQITKFVGISIVLILAFFVYAAFDYSDSASKHNPQAVNQTQSNTQSVSNGMTNNTAIPDSFEPFKVLNATIYLPKHFKKIDSPSIGNTNYGIESGIALAGEVVKKDDSEKDYRLNRFNVMVMFARSTELLKMKSSEEESALEATFNRYWQSSSQASKVATKRELLSKEFCKTTNGHKYLKAKFISGIPGKPNIDLLHNVAFYIFGDTMYHIDLDTMVRSNGKHNKDFEIILNTFEVL